MAVTGAIFNSLTFGGVNSADYGIYITGEAVFNAPERAVEMVDVPGRNGAVVLDQGRWENIEVTYPAGTFGMNEVEFKTALSNFRNAIVSQIGYQRLTDTYHPDEYRMAMYVSGLDVSPKHYNSAGEFKLTFNCKPQRWLANGDTVVPIVEGDTVTNPTPYDAIPLVELYGVEAPTGGRGTVFSMIHNGATRQITVTGPTIGSVTLAPSASLGYISFSRAKELLLERGDTISVTGSTAKITFNGNYPNTVTGVSLRSQSGDFSCTVSIAKQSLFIANAQIATIDFPRGTHTVRTCTLEFNVTVQRSNATTTTETLTVVLTATYSPSYVRSDSFIAKASVSFRDNVTATLSTAYVDLYSGPIVGTSTRHVLGSPTYIDCETGLSYQLINGEKIFLTPYISFNPDQFVIPAGTSEVYSVSANVETAKIAPRWWKL